MIDELNEATELSDDQEVVLDTAAPEEAPAEEVTDEKPLSGYDKRIAVLTAEKYHLKKLLDDERAAKAATPVIQEAAPVVPPYPDENLRWDDPAAFNAAIEARDAAQRALTRWEIRQEEQQRQRESANQTAQAAQQSQHKEIVTAFVDNGLKAGISEARMSANEAVLATHNINKDLALFLYSDQAGARLVDYLAQNPDEITALNGMHPTHAAVKIATELKPKALASKPHVTSAPDPLNLTQGGARPLGNEFDNLAVGCTFE